MNLDRIKARSRPWMDFRLLVVDGGQLTVAQQQLAAATERRRRADRNLVAEKPDRVKEVKNAAAAVKRAERALEDCWEKIRLTAMRPDEYEELKAAHPPTEGQLKDDPGVEYNRESLRPALLAECAEGLSAVEWAALLADRFSEGERQEIFTNVLAINEGARVVESVVLPKGWTGTRGSLLNLR